MALLLRTWPSIDVVYNIIARLKLVSKQFGNVFSNVR